MPEMSLAEIQRHLERLETAQRHLVSEKVYDRDLKELRISINEIKDSQKWLMRLAVSQFLGLVVALIVFLVTQGIG